MDELVNCKIVMGMKKAVQLIFDKFDILCQQKVKAMVKYEIDTRIKELKELAKEMQMNESISQHSHRAKGKVPQSPQTKKNSPRRLKKSSANKKHNGGTGAPADTGGPRGTPVEPHSSRTLKESRSKGSVQIGQACELRDLEHEKTPDFKIDLDAEDMILMPSTEKMFGKFTSEAQQAKE